MEVTRAKLRSWIERHRTLPNPSRAYLDFLRTQYRIHCEATVTRGKKNENNSSIDSTDQS